MSKLLPTLARPPPELIPHFLPPQVTTHTCMLLHLDIETKTADYTCVLCHLATMIICGNYKIKFTALTEHLGVPKAAACTM